MPAQEQELLNLTRNYEVTATIYNMFLKKLEEVRLEEKLASEDKNKESYQILEFARATLTPVAPNRLHLLLIIGIIGLGTGVGLMAVFSFFDDSLKNVDEAKAFIKRPLLGTVPCLDTDGDNGYSPVQTVQKRVLKAIKSSREFFS